MGEGTGGTLGGSDPTMSVRRAPLARRMANGGEEAHQMEANNLFFQGRRMCMCGGEKKII
eukprot:scaffold227657_cov33-Tisochrysis_lutea.AAC.1